jgi:hypothetical protein
MKATNLITCRAAGATTKPELDIHLARLCLIYTVFYYSPLLNVCDFKGTEMDMMTTHATYLGLDLTMFMSTISQSI